jgi:hypothetical protein
MHLVKGQHPCWPNFLAQPIRREEKFVPTQNCLYMSRNVNIENGQTDKLASPNMQYRYLKLFLKPWVLNVNDIALLFQKKHRILSYPPPIERGLGCVDVDRDRVGGQGVKNFCCVSRVLYIIPMVAHGKLMPSAPKREAVFLQNEKCFVNHP